MTEKQLFSAFLCVTSQTKTATKMKTRIVILDFDGTLGDSQTLIIRTMRETLQRVGLPEKTEEECAKTIGLPLK